MQFIVEAQVYILVGVITGGVIWALWQRTQLNKLRKNGKLADMSKTQQLFREQCEELVYLSKMLEK